MYRFKANDNHCYGNAFSYWRRKFYPNTNFPPMKHYEKWVKENYGCTDNGGDYLYFKTREEKFYFQTIFWNRREID